MRRRGMTVLELMLVLVLLVAMSALVVPALQNRVSGMAFTEACSTLEWASVRAREKAMREGRAVRLVARAERVGGPVDVFAEPAEASDLVGGSQDSSEASVQDMMMVMPPEAGLDDFGLGPPGGVAGEGDRSVAGADRLMRLPGGSRLALRWAFEQELDGGAGMAGAMEPGVGDRRLTEPLPGRPGFEAEDPFAEQDDGVDPEAVARAATALAEAPQLADRVIAVFLPDGRVVAAGDEPVFVSPDRVARFVVDPLLGVVRVERWIAPARLGRGLGDDPLRSGPGGSPIDGAPPRGSAGRTSGVGARPGEGGGG